MAKRKRELLNTQQNMEILKPLFYDQFRCKGGACRNTCCTANWNIYVDKKNYHFVRALRLDTYMNEKIAKGFKRNKNSRLEGDYASIQMGEGKYCPFLNDDKLCEIYIAAGHKALSHTCRNYPRNVFADGKMCYYILSPSCEEVVKHLLELPEGIDFTMDKAKINYRDLMPMDNDLAKTFHVVMTVTVDILQNRSYSIGERMLLLGLAMDSLVKEYKTEGFSMDKWAEKYQVFAQGDEYKGLTATMPKDSEKAIFFNINSLITLYTGYTAQEGRNDTLSYIVSTLEKIESGLVAQEMNFSRSVVKEKLELYQNYFQTREYFWENLLITAWMMLVHNRQPLERLFAELCVYYSLCRFTIVARGEGEYTQEYVEDVVAETSRLLLHGNSIDNLHKLMQAFEGTTVPMLAFLIL